MRGDMSWTWAWLVASGLAFAAPPQSRATACVTCHRAQAIPQPDTPMGRALDLPATQTILKAHPLLTFSRPGYSYSIERKGDLSTYTVSDGHDTLSLPIRYAMGVHSQTFVLEHQGRYYESLVSYYPAVGGLAITMGAEKIQPHNLVEAMGRELPASEAASCFGCHSTGAVTQGRLTIDTMQPGIQCEHCHAGAGKHAEDIAHGKADSIPRKLGQMSAEDLSEFCGSCHRSWETVVRMRVWGPLNVRFQPYRLANSKCFNGTDARIRCVACHDPHKDLVRDDAAYDGKCLACHAPAPPSAATAGKVCPVSKGNCVSCHMPKVELPGSHARFTDHDIRIVRANESYPN